VLRYGGMGPEVYERLKWMEQVLYPVLAKALQAIPDGIDIKSIIAQALHMGDESHNRNRAATSLLLRAFAPALARTCDDREVLAKGDRVHRSQRSLLPQPEHGRWKSHARTGRRRGRQHDRDGHGAQWHRFRHPPGKHARALVHCPG
jgi:hypothetical protein